LLADGYSVRLGVDLDDVEWMRMRDPKSLALADGEMLVASVGADGFAARVDELAFAERVGGAALDEARVVLVRNEADFLAVGLVVDGEIQLVCDFAHAGLFKFADGEQRVRKRVSGHAEEDVALILAMIETAHE